MSGRVIDDHVFVRSRLCADCGRPNGLHVSVPIEHRGHGRSAFVDLETFPHYMVVSRDNVWEARFDGETWTFRLLVARL